MRNAVRTPWILRAGPWPGRLLVRIHLHGRGGEAWEPEMARLYRPAGSQTWHWRGTVAGRQLRRTLKTSDLREARRVAAALDAAAAILAGDLWGEAVKENGSSSEARASPQDRRTLRMAWEAFLDGCSARGRQPRTLVGYGTHARAVCRVLGEDLELRELRGRRGVRALERYVAARRLAGVCPRTIRAEVRTLRAVLDLAIARGHLRGPNPVSLAAAILPPPSARKVDLELPSSAELDELEALLEVEDPPLRRFLAFARRAGMRRSEIARVAWEDVDLERRTLTWVNHKAGGAAGIAKIQTRALTAEALTFLAGLEGREDRQGRLFVSSDGYRARWRRFVERHPRFRGPRFQPLRLRHRLNSLLLHAGLPVRVVQTYLGHASSTMTLAVYSETVAAASACAGAAVEGVDR